MRSFSGPAINSGNLSCFFFQEVVKLKQQDGTMLEACGILHLVPTWINRLLKALTDHRLADPTLKEWWEQEIEAFIGSPIFERTGGHGDLLFKDHNDFRRTGMLSRDYLLFLWRHVEEIKNHPMALDFMIDTVKRHDLMLESPRPKPSGMSASEHGQLVVPFRFVAEVDLAALDKVRDSMRHGRRVQYSWNFGEYAPPNIVGLFLTHCLAGDHVKLDACWRSGLAFMVDDLAYLVCLHSVFAEEERPNVSMELTVAAQGDSMPLQTPAREMKERVEVFLRNLFPGLRFRLEVDAETSRGDTAWDACFNTLLGHLDLRLGEVGLTLQAIMEHTRESLATLNALHDKDFLYPSLVLVRPETNAESEVRGESAARGWCNKRALRELAYQVKACSGKPMRLCFVCPYDFSEVPCGGDGRGYPLRVDETWIREIFPVLQVSRGVLATRRARLLDFVKR